MQNTLRQMINNAMKPVFPLGATTCMGAGEQFPVYRQGARRWAGPVLIWGRAARGTPLVLASQIRS